MITHVVHTDNAPAALGPYSQAISVNFAVKGTVVFCSGQIGIDPASGNLREGFEAQVDQAFANVQAVVAAAGGEISGIAKLTLFLTDLANFAVVNAKMESIFQKTVPSAFNGGCGVAAEGCAV